VSAEVGSTGSVDKTDQDLGGPSTAPEGFMGKNTDVAWLRRIEEQYNQILTEDTAHRQRPSVEHTQHSKGKKRAEREAPGDSRESALPENSPDLSHQYVSSNFINKNPNLNFGSKMLIPRACCC